MLRQNIEDDHPALARQIARPIIVRDHDLMIFGVRAGGDKGAAITRSLQRGRPRLLLLLIQPRHVVVRNFFKRVERHNVINIQVNAVRLHAIGDALQLLSIFGIDMGPQHLARGLAKKIPIALGFVGVEKLDRIERVGNLRSQ